MKLKDLRQYKPLDITELSGSPWNTAEKVLGLDENDKVVMAEPDAVTYEEVEEAIDQAMATETARTESTYAKKGELPPLDDYYTKEETDAVVTSATQDMATKTWVGEQGYLTEHQDLSAYAKTTAVTQDIQTAIASETARTEDVYAKKSDIPDLDNYYTKSETDEAIEEAISGISLEGYWTSAETKNYVDTEIGADIEWTQQNFARKSEIPSLDGYATENYVDASVSASTATTTGWVESQGYLTEHQSLADYAKTTAVTADIEAAMAVETARTEDVYAKKSEIPSLDGYWTSGETKAYVDAEITGATADLPTKAWVTGDTASRIDTAIASETARTENTYAKPSDIPSLEGYATEEYVNTSVTAATASTTGWVESQGYLTQHQDISGKLDTSVFTAYTGTTETKIDSKLDTTAFTQAMEAETARTENTYLKKGETPSLDDYWTSAQTESAITEAIKTETGRTESTYAKIGDIPSLDGYWTSAQTQNAITAATDGLASEQWVTEKVDGHYAEEQITTGDPDLNFPNIILQQDGSNLMQAFLETDKNNIYAADFGPISLDETIQLNLLGLDGILGGEHIRLKLGIDSDITLTSANLKTELSFVSGDYDKKVILLPANFPNGYPRYFILNKQTFTGWFSDTLTIQGDWVPGKLDTTAYTQGMAAETARTESTYAKKSEIPSLDGYWTSAQTQNAITAATNDMATETWVQNQGYLTQHQDISGKLDVSVFTGYTGTTETALNGKVDLATYTAYTGSTATAIAGKQETLVSGTNIKTINNQSLLGSGNIDIQGGGGGGDNVVELTKAQYEALNPPAADTTYIITDADVVDLNDYAPASGLTELSGTVTTINSNYATKQNVTARASSNTNPYLPGWNSQGVITGASQVYSVGMSINGSNQNGLLRSSNTSLTGFYAPTSAGTAGQPLLSNGSGAPVWGGYKFLFMTQTQYDALATKDATTIYFITGD